MKYYVMPENELGQRAVIAETKGKPANIVGVDVINLPAGKMLTVKSRNKKFLAHKVAWAVACGQISIDDKTKHQKHPSNIWNGAS